MVVAMVGKDWIGNKKSTFVTLGASNHVDHDRAKHDYYATDPKAINVLMSTDEEFEDLIWEPACGELHLSKRLEDKAYGYRTYNTDIVARCEGITVCDFLNDDLEKFKPNEPFSIITNPPYKYAQEFIERALSVLPKGGKCAMFLKLTFLEGKKRKEFLLHSPPKHIYVSSSRLKCAINGDFENTGSSATCYAWFVWEKGYQGDMVVSLVN